MSVYDKLVGTKIDNFEVISVVNKDKLKLKCLLCNSIKDYDNEIIYKIQNGLRKSCGCINIKNPELYNTEINGYLVISKRDYILGKYKIKCLSCGVEKFISEYSLFNKTVKKCECEQKIPDIYTGKKYNNFTILEEPYLDKTSESKRVKVQCICGKIYNIMLKLLITGKTKSCGCVSFKKTNKMINNNFRSSNNLSGYKFGSFTAIECLWRRSKIIPDKFLKRWKLKCSECGKEKDYSHHYLLSIMGLSKFNCECQKNKNKIKT